MEWIDNLNRAIGYIELHLKEKLDYEEAAKICCCSLSKFQQIFLLSTGVTLSEYVRYRRMTIAAHGDGRNISGIGLQEREEIIQNTFHKYLELCKTALRNTPSVTEGNVKNNKINDLKSTIQLTTLADTLPA